MNTSFSGTRFLLKKQAIAMTGVFRIYDESNNLVAFSKQKMFKLKEDIRIYLDEKETQEILMIKARSALDFSASYDVVDSASQTVIGTLRRKGLRSMTRDSWEVVSTGGQVLGTITEDSAFKAAMRRVILGSLLPQSYDMVINGQPEMTLSQRFSMVGYQLDMTFTSANGQVDHRLGIAAGILLAAIEGKQSN